MLPISMENGSVWHDREHVRTMARMACRSIEPFIPEKPGFFLLYQYDGMRDALWTGTVLPERNRYEKSADWKFCALAEDVREEVTTFQLLIERPGLAVPDADGNRLWGGGFKTDGVLLAPGGGSAEKEEAFGLRFLQLMRPYFMIDDVARIATLSRNVFVLGHMHLFRG